MATASVTLAATAVERQLSSAAQGHVLTNINCWSPDGQWLVYDVRTGDAFNGRFIEQVHTRTGEVQRLYEATQGAFCGVVTYSPADSRVVFIHGPENPTAEWAYHFTRRRGAVVDAARPGTARPLDAMTYAPPFVPGALRGGSHVHVFSPDGRWVSYTYEDEVLARLDADPRAAGLRLLARRALHRLSARGRWRFRFVLTDLCRRCLCTGPSHVTLILSEFLS